MTDILIIDSVFKTYNDRTILSDIFIKCEIGDIIGVFGRNGSGKSTLFKIIYGITSAENRFVKLNDNVLQKPYLEKNGISYLPQDNFIPWHFTVKKAVSLSLEQHVFPLFYEDEILKKHQNSRMDELSGGELKYFQTKLLLFNESKFCLLDEPYSGLSPIMIDVVNQLIVSQSIHKGILIADHNYRYLLDVANRIYFLKDGSGRFLQNKYELIRYGYLSEGMI